MWDQINDALTESTRRVITGVANFLPGVLALLLAIILSWLLASFVGWVLRRFLRSIKFDVRMEQWGFSGLADWSPDESPTLLISKTASWIIIIIGILIGLSALQAELTSQLVLRLFEYMPNVLAAIVVLVLGTLIAQYLARGVLISAVNMQIQSARLLSLGVKWMVLVLTAAMALDHLRIGGSIVHLAFGILFGGIVLALSLAVGLGSKDMVSRTLQRQSKEAEEEPEEEFHHL